MAMLHWMIAAFALVGLFSTASAVELIEVPLPGLICSYSPGLVPFSNLYLGVSFREIQGASLRWAGSITPGVGHGDGVLLPRDETFPWPAQLVGFMDGTAQGLWLAPVGPLTGSFSEVTAFDAQGNADWVFLFDGIGHVEAYLNPLPISGGVMVTPPQASVETAVLLLEADTVTATHHATWGAIKSLFGLRQ